MPRQISKILMARTCRPEHVRQIEELLPDTEITVRGFMEASADDVDGADIIFGNVPPELLTGSSTVKWIQLASAGAEKYARAVPENIILTNATGAYGENIAEHMLAMLMYLQRKLGGYRENMIWGEWKSLGTVASVRGSKCLILGMGDLGGSFGRIVKAMGGRVIGLRRTPREKPDYAEAVYTMDMLDRLLPEADIVAMTLPDTQETEGIMDERRISLMKPDSYLINVGRGNAVDKTALAEALNEEKIAGAALDVTDPEPLPEDDNLWKTKNLLITPHVSGLTGTNLTIADKVQELFLYNLEVYLKDSGKMKNLVDRETGYRTL